MKRSQPPFDSALTFPNVEDFTLSEESTEEWSKKAEAVSTNRGKLLGFAYDIEYLVDLVILNFFFPKGKNTQDDQSRVRRGLFEGLFLKSQPPVTFSRKIAVLDAISRESVLVKVVPPELVGTLRKLKDIRNGFAHSPIAFNYEATTKGKAITAKLVCRDKDILLDDAFFEQLFQSYTSIRTELRKILRVFELSWGER